MSSQHHSAIVPLKQRPCTHEPPRGQSQFVSHGPYITGAGRPEVTVALPEGAAGTPEAPPLVRSEPHPRIASAMSMGVIVAAKSLFRTTASSVPQGPAGQGERATLASGAQTGDVDHEAIPHVAPDDPIVGLVDLLHRDELDVRDDVVLAAMIQHLLRLGDAADQ